MHLEDTVDFLRALRLERRSVEALPAALSPPDLAAAYRVQSALVERLCAHWGGGSAGYKVAVTNPAAQRMLGVHHPVFGRLLSARVHPSGTTLRAGDYTTDGIYPAKAGEHLVADFPGLGRVELRLD